jgi:DNA-binding transcriptional LysR family regulator
VNFTRLRYFDKVVRLGSIRRAAESLHIAASAISRQLASFEEELDTVLFEKAGRGLKLTPAGEIVAVHARTILSACDRLRLDVDDLQGLRRGHVRIWTVEGMLPSLVGRAATAFHREFPPITVEVAVASTDRILQALVDDDADIGIPFNPPTHPGIRTCHKLVDSLRVVFATTHELANRDQVRLADLSGVPVAVPNQSFGVRHLIDAEYEAAGIELRPAVVTNSIEMLRAFARSGLGCTFLTPMSVEQQQRGEGLVLVPIESPNLRAAHVDICVRADRTLPAAVSKMLEFLVRIADDLAGVALSATEARRNRSCQQP